MKGSTRAREIYGDRHSSLKRNDKHWTLEELARRQEPTQGRALAHLGVESMGRGARPTQDTAWRQAPSDHTQLLDLCALHYLRKVYNNHTVRLHGRVIDIPKRPDSAYATYAGKDVVVKHLLSGDRNNDKNEPPGGDIFT